MKEKILRFYYLDIISFKCSPLLFKHKRILRKIFSMTFTKITSYFRWFCVFNYRQRMQEYSLPQLEDLDMQNLWFQ